MPLGEYRVCLVIPHIDHHVAADNNCIVILEVECSDAPITFPSRFIVMQDLTMQSACKQAVRLIPS